MPHKDRAARLAYSAAHHAANRPVPVPEPQPGRDDLPPRGTMVFDDDGERVQCHACGRFFGGLNTHLRTHGLTADTYKETYGLARTASLWPPRYQERQRQAALARDQGAVGRAALAEVNAAPDKPTRPPGLPHRLSSRIAESAAKRGTYRGRPRKAQPA